MTETSDQIVESVSERAERFDLEQRAIEVAKVAVVEFGRLVDSTRELTEQSIDDAGTIATVRALALIAEAARQLKEAGDA